MSAMIEDWTGRLFSLSFVLLNIPGLLAARRESFTVKTPGAWVQVVALDNAVQTAALASLTPTRLLDDHQTRVTDRSVERYIRHVRLVAAQKDLGELSQIQIEFEPSYQTLTIHHIQIRRGAGVINAFRSAQVKMLHREEELEQQIFNGSVQAVAILSDVRIGDLIDFAYTIAGDNPVMGGKFDQMVELDSNVLVKRLRARLLWPRERKLFMRSHNTDLQPKITAGDETEYLWERRDVEPMEGEDHVPGWYFSSPWVDVSEFETWSDVVAWALPLYKAVATPELTVRIDAISKASSSPEARLLAALRLVQDEVRYMGIEMGPYSHQPTPPATVFARRFGDCKDKALLLTTILRALGIDAAPALVNTESGKVLDSRQPSPYAFDHAIVNVRLDGRTYWLDGTRTFQRGSLKHFYNPPYAKALVLRPGTSGLEDIPVTPLTVPTTFSDERYRVESLTSPVAFTVVTTYTGADADDMRYRLSRTALEKLGKRYLNFYAADNPRIEAAGLPQVKDDESTNTLIVTEKYSISNFWKDSIHHISPDQIVDKIDKPTVSRRSMPLRVKYPLNIRQRIEVEMPYAADTNKASRSLHDNAIQFERTSIRSGKTLVLEYSLKTLRDHVPVKEVPEHLATLDSILDNLGYRLPMNPSSEESDQWNFGALLIFIGFIVGVAFIAARVATRRRRAFQRQFTSRPGEDPSTAFAVTDRDAMLQYLLKQSCRCGKRFDLDNQPLHEETLVYDGSRITVFRIHCVLCNSDRDLYFKEARKAELNSPDS